MIYWHIQVAMILIVRHLGLFTSDSYSGSSVNIHLFIFPYWYWHIHLKIWTYSLIHIIFTYWHLWTYWPNNIWFVGEDIWRWSLYTWLDDADLERKDWDGLGRERWWRRRGELVNSCDFEGVSGRWGIHKGGTWELTFRLYVVRLLDLPKVNELPSGHDSCASSWLLLHCSTRSIRVDLSFISFPQYSITQLCNFDPREILSWPVTIRWNRHKLYIQYRSWRWNNLDWELILTDECLIPSRLPTLS